MFTLPRKLLVLTISAAALVNVGRAQILTADTFSSSGAITYTGVGSGYATTQTVSGITSIDTVTFRMLVNLANPTNTFGTSTVNYYVSAWNSGTGVATGTAIASGTAALPASTAWQSITYGANNFGYFDLSLDLSSVATGLTPADTYAISFYGSSAGTVYGAGNINNASSYANGGTFTSNGPFNSASDLQSIASADASSGYDMLFSAGSLTPVPEAGTTSVIFAGLFVMGLMGWRLRQRRLAAVPNAAIS